MALVRRELKNFVIHTSTEADFIEKQLVSFPHSIAALSNDHSGGLLCVGFSMVELSHGFRFTDNGRVARHGALR